MNNSETKKPRFIPTNQWDEPGQTQITALKFIRITAVFFVENIICLSQCKFFHKKCSRTSLFDHEFSGNYIII